MEITKKSLTEIKELLNSYGDKKYDMNVYHNIIEILRSDKSFDNPILLGKGNSDSPAYIIPTEEKLYYSDDVISYSSDYRKNNYSFFPFLTELDCYRYKFIFTLFHELAHLKQCDYALHSKSKYEIINKLYKQVLFNGELNKEHYIDNPYDYVYEYNADLEAANVLLHLFSDNPVLTMINNLEYSSHVCNEFADYDGDKPQFLSEKTYKLLNITDDSIKRYYDLPLEILIHNGLPIKDEILDHIFGNSDDEFANAVNLLDIRQKIKSIK